MTYIFNREECYTLSGFAFMCNAPNGGGGAIIYALIQWRGTGCASGH